VTPSRGVALTPDLLQGLFEAVDNNPRSRSPARRSAGGRQRRPPDPLRGVETLAPGRTRLPPTVR